MDLRRSRFSFLTAVPPNNQRDWLRGLLALRSRTKLTVVSGAILLAVLSSHEARAEFTVCNQTLDVVNLAVGQRSTMRTRPTAGGPSVQISA